MNGPSTITKQDVIKSLDQRIYDLSKELYPDDGSSQGTIIRHWEYFKVQLNNLDRQYDVFGKNFWGYGINDICDGRNKYFNPDISIIKKNGRRYGVTDFYLIIFKVEKGNFVYSTFGMNLQNMVFQSEPIQQVSLKLFKYIKPRIDGQNIFIEIGFEELELPISFQLETYQSYNINSHTLSKFYINSINEAVELAKENTLPNYSVNLLDNQITSIELKLRTLILTVLRDKLQILELKGAVNNDTYKKIDSRIEKHLNKHPKKDKEQFKLLINSIQFLDLMECSDIIINKANWTHFSSTFNNKEAVTRYFVQLSELRNTFRHSREATDLIIAEGKASVIWFNMALNDIAEHKN